MAKHTITIEDLPDGGVWISSTPSIDELAALCSTPERMTSADSYAAEVHMALRRAADRALADMAAPSALRN